MNACAPFRALIEKLSIEAQPEQAASDSVTSEGETEIRIVIERLVDLVELLSESGPLLIRATDLQWMDEGSFEAYRRLGDLTLSGLIILADLRTDEQQGYWNELSADLRESGQLVEIQIGSLTPDDEAELTRNLIGPVNSRRFFRKLSRTCRGVPFFVYEFLRNVQQNGELRYRSGAWAWEPDNADGKVPETVAEHLNRRFERLHPDEQELLEYLSVLDREISVGILARILEKPINEIITLIERLGKLDFVSIEGTLTDPVTELRHAWLAQTIRERLSNEKHRAHHLRIAKCLEQDYLKSPEPYLAETLTKHFLEARSIDQTNRYIWPALSYLKAGKLYRDAADLLDKATGLGVVSLSQWQTTWEYLELLYASGRLEDCRRVAEGALAIWPSCGNSAQIYGLLGRIDVVRGEFRRGTGNLERALGTLEDSGSSELEAETLCELLCCLSRTREKENARSIAHRLFRGLIRAKFISSKEKLYHALYFHLSEHGLPWEALQWEVRSLKASIINENSVRICGRLFNLGATYLDLGWWQTGSKLNSSALDYAQQIGNAELGIYAQTNLAIELRKKGQHKEAVSVLEKALRLNKRLNKNPHLEIELNIELAKNAVYQLYLSKAQTYLDYLSELIRPDEVFSSSADVQLLTGWLSILSGEPEKAEALVEKLRSREIPREAGRIYLLSGWAKLTQDNLTGAMEDANRALRHFPNSAPYYRVRTRLLQSEIALRDPSIAKAGAYIRDALRVSKEHYYVPLLATAYMLRAKWLIHTSQPVEAKAHCLSALQVSSTVERPLLLGEIHNTLGAIEAGNRKHDSAIKHIQKASDLLRERYRSFPSNIKESFFTRHLQPIEQNLAKHQTNRSRSSPQLLNAVNDFAQAVKDIKNRDSLAKTILRFITREIPETSANLYFRSGEDQHFHLAGSAGKCSRSGRQLLRGDKDVLADVQPFSYNGVSALALFLRSGGSISGLLYTERAGPVTEGEFDYLQTLKSITDLLPQPGGNGHTPSTLKVSGLALKDGRLIVGNHVTMRRVFDEVRHLAKSKSIVLISGETGTGKELVARAIHDYSPRRAGTFLPVNCAAIQRDLIENELFGHLQGSFTGAATSTRGVFEGASGGTLFLDEVSAMPLELQTRFLRVLETKRVRRLGEVRERKIDTRIVAATNQNLRELVRKGRFRSDLYHRLNVLQIELPPLRTRLSDVPALCNHFLSDLNNKEDRQVHITEEALTLLRGYQFPGNVRELRNMVESVYHTAEYAIAADAIRSRLDPWSSNGSIDNDRLAEIMEEMTSGRSDFWRAVRKPFLNRDLSRREVRHIISLGLEACGGSYRKLIEYFGLPQDDYKKFLGFLSAHDCKVDFRPFRNKKY
jgi:DNA-binding NtrC family response regulator/tetratricopeptide (TPR) repeat protein